MYKQLLQFETFFTSNNAQKEMQTILSYKSKWTSSLPVFSSVSLKSNKHKLLSTTATKTGTQSILKSKSNFQDNSRDHISSKSKSKENNLFSEQKNQKISLLSFINSKKQKKEVTPQTWQSCSNQNQFSNSQFLQDILHSKNSQSEKIIDNHSFKFIKSNPSSNVFSRKNLTIKQKHLSHYFPKKQQNTNTSDHQSCDSKKVLQLKISDYFIKKQNSQQSFKSQLQSKNTKEPERDNEFHKEVSQKEFSEKGTKQTKLKFLEKKQEKQPKFNDTQNTLNQFININNYSELKSLQKQLDKNNQQNYKIDKLQSKEKVAKKQQNNKLMDLSYHDIQKSITYFLETEPEKINFDVEMNKISNNNDNYACSSFHNNSIKIQKQNQNKKTLNLVSNNFKNNIRQAKTSTNHTLDTTNLFAFLSKNAGGNNQFQKIINRSNKKEKQPIFQKFTLKKLEKQNIQQKLNDESNSSSYSAQQSQHIQINNKYFNRKGIHRIAKERSNKYFQYQQNSLSLLQQQQNQNLSQINQNDNIQAYKERIKQKTNDQQQKLKKQKMIKKMLQKWKQEEQVLYDDEKYLQQHEQLNPLQIIKLGEGYRKAKIEIINGKKYFAIVCNKNGQIKKVDHNTILKINPEWLINFFKWQM